MRTSQLAIALAVALMIASRLVNPARPQSGRDRMFLAFSGLVFSVLGLLAVVNGR